MSEKPGAVHVDKLGYLPFAPDAAHLFFQLVSKRYERGSLMLGIAAARKPPA